MAILASGRRRMERRIATLRNVAARARHCHVRPFQSEPGLVVRGECEGFRLPTAGLMAVLAPVAVRFGRKLALVSILVAGGAEGEGHAVWRVFADRKSTRLNSSHLVISYAVF